MNIKNKIKKIDPARPSPEIIRQTGRIIKNGGVAAFPTRCLYGIAADAFNLEAVGKIFQIKNRPHDKPILVLIESKDDLGRVVKKVPQSANKIMERFWPGEITLIFEANDSLPSNLTAKTGKIGVRVPEHAVALALIQSAGHPITGTSANLSSQSGCSRIDDLDHRVAEKLDLILDAGPLKGGVGSTVVDVTTDPPTILREGEITRVAVLEVLGDSFV